ncbi:DNA mismatch repair protein MutS [Prochlorothrix hollandica]|uniref:DNA mismatch repair protein MutS n=1 Tax=Prochlorothrix hollandica TaxID=1223 RepID=UPI00333F0A1C
MTSPPSTPADLPQRLVKHAVKHTHHQDVDWEQLTPMMRHYVEVKSQHKDALLLYRMGDFFECFLEDAITVARELELVLTSKEGGGEVGRVPMAGIPHKALDGYCAKLVDKGYAVAICDQVEDAAQAKGPLVRRAITRIITPGTILEDGMLQGRRNNFLGAVVLAGNHWGLAFADVSTGEFATTQSSDLDQLNQELQRLSPSEVLLPTPAPDLVGLLRPDQKSQYLPEGLPPQLCYTLRPQKAFDTTEARQRLLQRFRVRSLEGMGCEGLPLAIRAAGGLLSYLEDTSEGRVQRLQAEDPDCHLHPAAITAIPLQPLHTYAITAYLILDAQTRRNLEIVQTVRDGSFHGSLLWALDATVTTMGGRSLRRWLLQPLLDPRAIAARHDTVQELLERGNLRGDLRQILGQIYDLERLTGRAGSGTANGRDLVALADSFAKLPDIAQLLADTTSPYLAPLKTLDPSLEALGQRIHGCLVAEPPLLLLEGGLIRSGVHPELDALRQESEDDRQWVANLESLERERTGINTLKVGYNKTFGYYLAITRSKTDQVPEDYIRKQTLTNEERYITPELKERETRLATAQSQLNLLEYEIFSQLRAAVGEQAELIRQVAQRVAALDVLAAFAELAQFRNYCRPQMRDDRPLAIHQGRHPVVERSLPPGFFVPNSTALGYGTPLDPPVPGIPTAFPTPDLVILTGPNASGKSCYLRQVGLIQLMAQVGSFVPATAASLGICDRIFTRVGAVDDLATGQSTFMVEMNETANILHHATPQSLVLLDEIGRGTATFDGLSIAWAVAEYLASEIRARSIFATHYHEMNELASLLPNVANFQVTVKELPDDIVFLHQVQPGGADRSYGIEAARLAGLPRSVIDRARQVMTQIEKHSKIAMGLRKGAPGDSPHPSRKAQPGSPEPPQGQQQLDMF